MNALLLFFALPVATILLAIVLQRMLKCPILVAITFFAIYLIVTFAVFDATFLVFAILYAILAYITALITKFICRIIRRIGNNNCGCICGNNECCDNSNSDTDVVSATCRVAEEDINDIANQAARQTTCALLNAINNSNNNSNNNNNNNCSCNRRV